MALHSGCSRIEIDPLKHPRLHEEPAKGHNRWHEEITPILSVTAGELVIVETRDGFDGQVNRSMGSDDLYGLSFFPNHPMTGPIFIEGAEPGDTLEVEVVDIEPDPYERYGFTTIMPGFGLLREDFKRPFVAHWDLNGRDFAISPEVPGVKIQFEPFCGIMGVAPSAELRERIIRRETDLAQRRGSFFGVLLPTPAEATPSEPRIASEALRSMPPRENGGNLDVRQLTIGSYLYLPVFQEGALFSVGDVHYAQGDGETCGAAIEMRARVHLRFTVHKHEQFRSHQDLRFVQTKVCNTASNGATRIGVTAHSIREGTVHFEDVSMAAKESVRAMIRLLMEAEFSAEQAYVITSVASSLRISQIVNLPTVSVTTLLNLGIFEPETARKLSGASGPSQIGLS